MIPFANSATAMPPPPPPPLPPSASFVSLFPLPRIPRVFNVMCFDRAARVLFGCSADDFFHFSKLHPFAASNAAKILEGEMFRMTLSRPKNGNAQHLRAVSIVPLRSGFKPAIESLKEFYGVKPATS
ncbi:hypothetical protein OIU74_004380 [Salix koriyanagi]|uniref:Uncharacterized protein n=1 Tax=Salix koriyanagi TaxID=2511006 RepID=A0A9Q0UZY6_9ROSI|nr:hypothetical protein OIU74_004380 [Salix koriyanagi]